MEKVGLARYCADSSLFTPKNVFYFFLRGLIMKLTIPADRKVKKKKN